MEKVKIHTLKREIEEARENCTNPVTRDALDRIMKSVQVCPAQFLRITKMYEEVLKIRNSNRQMSNFTKLEILENFQEKTAAGF